MCTEMMCKGKRKGSAVYLAAVVILTCYLAPTIDCYRLRKTERREGWREADAAQTAAVQEGKILFGRVFENGSGLGSHVDGNKKSSSNASVDDEAAYQADSAGWSKGQVYDPSPKEASFKRMSPSLQCGADQLKFRAVGPGATQFTVDQVNAPPMPLSQVPSTCGYNMQRNPLGLVMLVPYDGCNMVQEGGRYVLPMHWQGTPVSLVCPKPAAPASTTAAPHHPAPHHPAPQVPQVPQPYYFPPYMYPKYPLVPKPTTTTTTTTAAKKPQIPQYPQYPFYPPFYPYPQPVPVTTAAPTTTTAKPAAVTFPPPMFPFPFYPLPWPFPGPLPATPKPTTAKPTTTTTKAPTKPPVPPFPPFLPFYPPFNPFYPPFMPPYPNFPTPKPTTTTPKTTTTPTTTTKKDPTLHPHIHPHVHYPYPFPPFPPPFPMSG